MINRWICFVFLSVLLAAQAGIASATQYQGDTSFGNSPYSESLFDLGDVNSRETWALRVFERPAGAGYYILARHGHGNGTWDAVVLAVDALGKNEKKYLIPTPMFRLDDAAYDSGNGKFYFVGGAKQAGHADSDFALTCMDITIGSSGGPCAGFGSSGTVFTGFDLGGNKDDVARRVVSRSGTGIIVAGWAKDGANRYVFAVSAYYRDTGAPLSRFGNGGKFNHDVYQTGNADLDVNVYDIALSEGSAQDTVIYIAGNYSRVAAHNDYVGLVWALRGWDGTLAPFGVLGYRQIQAGLNNCSIDCSEAVTAVSVRYDGSLAFSGWAYGMFGRDGYSATLGSLDAYGSFDNRACNGTSVCWFSLPSHGNGDTPHSVAEHPMNRQLIMAYTTYIAEEPTPYMSAFFVKNPHGGSGVGYGRHYAYPYPAHPPALYNSYPANTIAVGNTLIEVGTYGYDEAARDYRIAIARYVDTDTIFFDAFGGKKSD